MNSLSKRNRQIELAVGVIGIVLGTVFVLATSIGMFAGTVAALREEQAWVLCLLLWAVFLVWQFAPILFEGHSPGVNFNEIARYPVSFRMYCVLHCVYGLVDPAAITGMIWLACIWTGVVVVRPQWWLAAAAPFSFSLPSMCSATGC